MTKATASQALGRCAEARAALAAARRLRPGLTRDEVARVHGRRAASQLAPLWADGMPPPPA